MVQAALSVRIQDDTIKRQEALEKNKLDNIKSFKKNKEEMKARVENARARPLLVE